METSFGNFHQVFRGQCRQTVAPRSNRRGKRLTSDVVTAAIAARLRPLAPKSVAAAAGVSVRTAENVRAGLNAMSLTNFLNACRAIPELRALAMELMGCQAETDPEFVKGLSMLMNAYARRSAASDEPSTNEGDA